VTSDTPEPLWRPSRERVERTNLTAFLRLVNAEHTPSPPVASYADLHRFSLSEPAKFWRLVWSFGGVLAETAGRVAVQDPHAMPGARFFPEARLNFAENLLRRRDPGTAIVFRAEDGRRRSLSFEALHQRVAGLATWLLEAGIEPGDRVAGYLPNLPETVITMLAATSVGAVFSSCSPDFGATGVRDRFGQIEPKVLVAADGALYGGKAFSTLERLAEIRAALPSVERVLVVPYLEESPDLSGIPDALPFGEASRPTEYGLVPFRPLPFDHPVYVLYSSGTTGAPKCIVHGAGGTLLQHLKEHLLHVDLKRDERFFYFTTCGWMMWNWLVSGLASGATLVLYDGSPFHPGPSALLDLAEQEGVHVLGASARWIAAIAKEGLEPSRTHDLSALKAILSTGSPLAPESFDYVYSEVKPEVHLASISGGTDIVSCFVGGDPTAPVWRGEIQAPGLGMAVDVFDEKGRPVRQKKGELVCTRPFPSMPLGFWNDPGGRRYRKAYFERFPHVWCHGDLAEITEHGGFVIHGRSDAVLNPGGVRIGTAEIYRQVESVDEVLEALAIAQEWEGDERVVLFVRLREGEELDDALRDRIRERVRSGASPRHVPARIVQVDDIPRTKSGKIVELAVRDVVHGRAVAHREALANPEALELFAERPELRE